MLVIAIDGPSGAGKSTLAVALSERLGLARLDTGAMYRAVALAALDENLNLDDEEALAQLARRMELSVGTQITLAGIDVTAAIRRPEVSEAASRVAAKPAVRRELVRRQRAWIDEHHGGIVEGRDIGSVVAPDAHLKIFLTADLTERGRRRTEELIGTQTERRVDSGPNLAATIEESIHERDVRDQHRSASPLVVSPGAVVIDSTGRSVEDIVEEVISKL